MKKNIFSQAACMAVFLLASQGCTDQLDVGNPNAPTFKANVNTEKGLISYAQGGIYINGFFNGDGWLGNSYFSLPWGYQELMADNVGADASNNQVSTIGVPDYIILDNGTKVLNRSSSSVDIIHAYNTRAATGASNNPVYYQWLNMYAMNSACNKVLELVDGITFEGDQESKANTVKAWCYWWKGYAYSSLGLMYYSGLINNEVDKTNGNYVLHDELIAESNKYYNLATTTLSAVTNTGDYSEMIGQLIPSFTQTGKGGVLTIDMWKRNINTMLARNLLMNKLSPFINGNPAATITGSSLTSSMSAADWETIRTLTTNGIRVNDYVFTGRTTGTNDFFTATGGTVAAMTARANTVSTYKISERLIQNFKTGDRRFSNNFNTTTTYNNTFTFTTRYSLTDGGAGNGAYVYGSRTVGEHELLIAGTYEENELMLAEALIRQGNSDGGLQHVDAVRTYMGAGIAAVSGTGLTASQALTELVRERKVALVFRGLSFYDNRRWGRSYDIAQGGGSYGNTLVQANGTVYTNVTINYNFMDFWDVPADETDLNPPSDGN